jgi:putative phosphoribosyl transferase
LQQPTQGGADWFFHQCPATSSAAQSFSIDFFGKQDEESFMAFASRQDAGRQLGQHLRNLAVDVDLIAGLPRGGVVVAAEVADMLQRPLDVIVVRKIGHPAHREFALGALAENGVVILDQTSLALNPVARADLDRVIAEETERLRDCVAKFESGHKTGFSNRNILIVDDGLATGATAEAAVLSARSLNARKIIMAAPVASPPACERLIRVADDAITLINDPDFCAVGQYYRQFLPTTDEEVLALLHRYGKSLQSTA